MAGVKDRSGRPTEKTIAEHKLDGTYRNNRHGGIIQTNAKQVDPEGYISNNSTKAALFERFSELLYNEGLTSGEVDSLYISQIVDLYDAYTQAAEVYNTEGVAARVGPKLAITLMIEIQKELRIQMGEYALTPSTRAAKARTKDTTATVVTDDPVADFLNMRPRLVK